MEEIIKPFKDAPLGIRLGINNNIPEIFSVKNSRKLTDSEQGILIRAMVGAVIHFYRQPATKEVWKMVVDLIVENSLPEKDTGWLGKLLGDTSGYKDMTEDQVEYINDTVRERVYAYPITKQPDPIDRAVMLHYEVFTYEKIREMGLSHKGDMRNG